MLKPELEAPELFDAGAPKGMAILLPAPKVLDVPNGDGELDAPKTAVLLGAAKGFGGPPEALPKPPTIPPLGKPPDAAPNPEVLPTLLPNGSSAPDELPPPNPPKGAVGTVGGANP